MKDLEIRGAGHLFGEQQHGTMEAVGLRLFHPSPRAGDQGAQGRDGRGGPLRDQPQGRSPHPRGLHPGDERPAQPLQADLLGRRPGRGPGRSRRKSGTGSARRRPASIHLLQYGRIKFLAGRLRSWPGGPDRPPGHPEVPAFHAPSTPPGCARLLNRTPGALTPQGVMSLPFRPRTDSGRFCVKRSRVLQELSGIG